MAPGWIATGSWHAPFRRGLVQPDHDLSDHELFQLIMEPGFSTARAVTNVSGRGIGMDVVRRNIESLRGTVIIDSAPGQGTFIALRLPLTLAIIDGFLVGVGASAFVVPLEMVVECLELPAQDRAGVREGGYINLRGDVLPLLRLRDVFETHGEVAKRENVVVVQYAGHQAGFVVDALMGEFQTVIKPLGKLFERLAGISGSTILGTGDVALILDVPGLIQKVMQAESARQARAGPRHLPEGVCRGTGAEVAGHRRLNGAIGKDNEEEHHVQDNEDVGQADAAGRGHVAADRPDRVFGSLQHEPGQGPPGRQPDHHAPHGAAQSRTRRRQRRVQEPGPGLQDLLLRGRDTKDYENYLAAFRKQEGAVQEQLQKVRAPMQALGMDPKQLDDIAKEHRAVSAAYLEGTQELGCAEREQLHGGGQEGPRHRPQARRRHRQDVRIGRRRIRKAHQGR